MTTTSVLDYIPIELQDQPIYMKVAELLDYVVNGASVIVSGNTTINGSMITGISSTAGLFISMQVTGPGIPDNTTVVGLSDSTATLSNQATATAISVSFTFSSPGYTQDLGDTVNKYKNPALASTEVVNLVVAEFGFDYLLPLIASLQNIDISILLNFMSLLQLMKGTRRGLELVLGLLGLTTQITEWWETTPRGPPQTFQMTVFMNLSQVPDVFATLDTIRTFTLNFVYPLFTAFEVVFDFLVATAPTGVVSFVDQSYSGLIQGTL